MTLKKTDIYSSSADSKTGGAEEREYELTEPLVVTAVATEEQRKIPPRPPTMPRRSLNEKYAKLANLRKHVKWEDPFFDDEFEDPGGDGGYYDEANNIRYHYDNEDDDYNEEDIIAVFDFDYDKMESFYTSIGWASLAATLLYPPVFLGAVLLGTPCMIRKNVRWSNRTKHVAITRDGIRFVHDRRPSCWGLSLCDRGKISKTVPYDKITDCDIEEPAGNSCLCVPNVLCVVNVDTASSGGEGHRHELRLAGLKDPHSFKKLVWAMKRHTAASAANANQGSNASPQSALVNEEVSSLLREIRDEIRVNNNLLQKQQQQQQESQDKGEAGNGGSVEEGKFV